LKPISIYSKQTKDGKKVIILSCQPIQDSFLNTKDYQLIPSLL